MADIEKYIEVLSKTVKTVKEFNEDAPIKISLQCVEDILELLKEKEETISELQNAYGYLQKLYFETQDKLLKEQEAVEPYQHDAVWLCGNCEKEVVGWDDDIDGKEYRYPFCRQCGKSVKWDD